MIKAFHWKIYPIPIFLIFLPIILILKELFQFKPLAEYGSDYYYVQMSSNYDVIIIGCGHAGSEAILACSRSGVKAAVFCLDFSKAASMPCNPSIGGSAKGQIVGEIDAMGGVMGEAADNTYMQIKCLNRSRGPAVHALRTQNDKYEYPKYF